METTLILSDLHLGHPAGKIEAVEQLQHLVASAARMILNGDTIEQVNPAILGRSRILQQQLAALCRENQCHCDFLTGNHDPGAGSAHVLSIEQSRLLITHGDVFFHGLAPWSRESAALVGLHRELLKKLPHHMAGDLSSHLRLARKLAQTVEVRAKKVGRRSFAAAYYIARESASPWRGLKVLQAWRSAVPRAAALLRHCRRPERFICFGHTHRPGLWQRDGRIFFNTGAFMSFSVPHCILLESGRLDFRPILKKAGRFEIGPSIQRFTLQDTPVFFEDGMRHPEALPNPLPR